MATNFSIYDVQLYDEAGVNYHTAVVRAANDRVACAVVLNEIVPDEHKCADWRMWKNGSEVKPIASDYR